MAPKSEGVSKKSKKSATPASLPSTRRLKVGGRKALQESREIAWAVGQSPVQLRGWNQHAIAKATSQRLETKEKKKTGKDLQIVTVDHLLVAYTDRKFLLFPSHGVLPRSVNDRAIPNWGSLITTIDLIKVGHVREESSLKKCPA